MTLKGLWEWISLLADSCHTSLCRNTLLPFIPSTLMLDLIPLYVCVCVCDSDSKHLRATHTPRVSHTIIQKAEDARWDRHRDIPTQRASDSQNQQTDTYISQSFSPVWSHSPSCTKSPALCLRRPIFRCLRTCGFALDRHSGKPSTETGFTASVSGSVKSTMHELTLLVLCAQNSVQELRMIHASKWRNTFRLELH